MDELLGIKDVATLFNCSSNAIWLKIQDGRLHPQGKLGSVYYFTREYIEDYLKNSPILVGKAAKEIGVSTSTLRKWIRDGKVEAVEVSGGWAISPATLEALKGKRPGRKAYPANRARPSDNKLDKVIDLLTKLLEAK